MSKDSVYQQLRSHLAYLNLPATAEALPTHLEQARQTRHGSYRVPREAAPGRSRNH